MLNPVLLKVLMIYFLILSFSFPSLFLNIGNKLSLYKRVSTLIIFDDIFDMIYKPTSSPTFSTVFNF